jgi:xanthine dehydrogenase YagT iron-sulfur-binding subunit
MNGHPCEPRGVSRRAFFKGAGASAVGAALLDSALAQTSGKNKEDAAEPDPLGPGPVSVSLLVNGRKVSVQIDPATTLVEVIRNHLGLTGTKVGCDRGACSGCTVWIDGQPSSSCMTFALDARGKDITTIEGLADGEQLHAVQQAFVDHDALQCGFCTPGMIMSCTALLKRKPNADLDDVKDAISGHLCRCGAYPNIFKAALSVANGNQGKAGE